MLRDILRALAVKIIARYAPKVIAVAGSVGKTSTRRAVAAVLRKGFRVRESHKNFNNEIGVPLTILGEEDSGGRNPFAWAGILARGVWTAYGPKAFEYPAVLVLEMATDKPGDLAYLTGIARPDVAVVTAVAEEHTEFLGDLDGVAAEEGTVVEALGTDGVAILNADDPRVADIAKRAGGARIIRYGLAPSADVKARGVGHETAMGIHFLRFDLIIGGEPFQTTIAGAVGMGNVSAALGAAAVGTALGVEAPLIPYGLAEFHPPPGRLRVLPGIKGTTLIDDTYNSSPKAAELALETLGGFGASEHARRYAVMADMLELGALTEESHRRIGRKAAGAGADVLVGVGQASAFLCDEARKAGMPEDRVFHMHDAAEAGHFLQGRIKTGDIILIKGSRGMRMERAVKELMAEPERAAELLVGQGH